MRVSAQPHSIAALADSDMLLVMNWFCLPNAGSNPAINPEKLIRWLDEEGRF